MIKVGVLTSSRSDFGIYSALINKLSKDSEVTLELIAFGSHTSRFHGFTINEIHNSIICKIHSLDTVLTNDDIASISSNYAITCFKFAEFWKNNSFDIVFCLGDRYEMNAAVQAAIPFRVKFAHIHGGETTTGSFDNIYRHQITLASSLHFTSHIQYSKRVEEIINCKTNIYTIGALSLEDLEKMTLLKESSLRNQYCIPAGEFGLVTFHPETINPEVNFNLGEIIEKSLGVISEKISLVISMPNTDTFGSLFRIYLNKLKNKKNKSVILIENFGKVGYFSAMKYSKCLIGNSSSGIIEAASFGKFAVNIGERQKGRIQSGNVLNCPFISDEIINTTFSALNKGNYTGKNIYFRRNASDRIITVVKNFICKYQPEK